MKFGMVGFDLWVGECSVDLVLSSAQCCCIASHDVISEDICYTVCVVCVIASAVSYRLDGRKLRSRLAMLLRYVASFPGSF